MSMEVKFTIADIVDARRAEAMMTALVDAYQDVVIPERELGRKATYRVHTPARKSASALTLAPSEKPTSTAYDEIRATLAEQTDGEFAEPGDGETDQQFFRRLAEAIAKFDPSVKMPSGGDAWYDSVVDAYTNEEDITAPPGYYSTESADVEPVEAAPIEPPPANPRDKLQAYTEKRKQTAAAKAVTTPKEKRGRKSKASVAAPTNGTAEPAPADEPIRVAEVGNGEDIETARTRLREIASAHGVDWLRQTLAQHGVQKLSDLDDTRVRLILDNVTGFGAAA